MQPHSALLMLISCDLSPAVFMVNKSSLRSVAFGVAAHGRLLSRIRANGQAIPWQVGKRLHF
jgi:hypothetical protein